MDRQSLVYFVFALVAALLAWPAASSPLAQSSRPLPPSPPPPPALPPYSLPQNNPLGAAARAQNISIKQAGYLYGPPVAGGPFFPSGALGTARAGAGQVLIPVDGASIPSGHPEGQTRRLAGRCRVYGLQTMDDY